MNITIIGGGTAGWLTSLLVKKYYPHYDISLIESDDIGILGAGEGTVPHFINVLEELKISINDLVKECSATLKLGIKFTNWNGDLMSYMHGFDSYKVLSIPALVSIIGDNKHLDLYSLPKLLVSRNRTSFIGEFKKENPMEGIETTSFVGLHFNARKLALFLRKTAEQRGIKRIEGIVNYFENDEQGNIKNVVLKDTSKIKTNFTFDCSGFARLTAKHYGTEWKSYQKHLPMNSAIPFFIEHDNTNIKPITEAIAMKYGWVWKIPVKDRYGCGYVFDSNYIDKDKALQEAEEFFGIKLQSPKHFKFEPGCYKDTYVKNTMSVGLSQSFVEPLEATSIWVFCMNLLDFLRDNGINNKSEIWRKQFNAKCLERNSNVVDFLYLHYMTQRNDSDFWRNFREKTTIPESVEQVLEVWKDVPPTRIDGYMGNGGPGMFHIPSWLQVANGLKLLNTEAFKKYLTDTEQDVIIKEEIRKFSVDINEISRKAIPHDVFLDTIRKN